MLLGFQKRSPIAPVLLELAWIPWSTMVRCGRVSLLCRVLRQENSLMKNLLPLALNTAGSWSALAFADMQLITGTSLLEVPVDYELLVRKFRDELARLDRENLMSLAEANGALLHYPGPLPGCVWKLGGVNTPLNRLTSRQKASVIFGRLFTGGQGLRGLDFARALWEASSGAQQLVLLGDPHQLPPTVLSAKAVQWGLSKTLFDRLSEKHLPMLLDTQFRMHPTLCAFPAAAFYGSQLKTSGVTAELVALEFRGVHGPEKQIGSSFCNASEADIVISILPELATDLESILLVAPYRAQRGLLERRLADLPRKDPRLQVSTIDALQGGECDFLIFSATRSNAIGAVGFLRDKRRVNVVLTRARRGIIVVGDPRTLANDATWAAWMEFAAKKGRCQELETR
eukprot:s1039_g19.t1